jgi:L,D-transpeptidase YcbB
MAIIRLNGLKIGSRLKMHLSTNTLGTALALVSGVAFAAEKPPVSILPPSMTAPPATAPAPTPPVAAPPATVQPVSPEVLQHWKSGDVQGLLSSIDGIASRGLNPSDYAGTELRAALALGEGEALDRAAKTSFDLLFGDMRDGRTPKSARVQWLVRDSDAAATPLDMLMRKALETKDFDGLLKSVEPAHPDYAALKLALASTPLTNIAARKLIRANMDRWRWLPRQLGVKHVFANVPEYMIRVVTYGKTIATYKAIVGKMSSQTPSLMVPAIGIVVHPTWTIPSSLIKEEVGPMIARSPAAARARGYTWTGSGPSLSVVQKAGPNAALGYMKIDMPNPDAIFLHDTPNRTLFARYPRAFSHGCLRTERAMEFGILLGILQSGQEAEDLAAIIKQGKTQKVPFKESIPVAITYFTYGTGMDGKLQAFADLYGRDAPILASMDKPRPVPAPAATPMPPPILPSETVAAAR